MKKLTDFQVTVEPKLSEERKLDTGFLKPYGKVKGNNVFTFHRPIIEELRNTLASFPAPVYWLTSESILNNKLLENFYQELEKVICLTTLDGRKNQLKFSKLSAFLTEVENSNAMVLISCNSDEAQICDEILKEVLKK